MSRRTTSSAIRWLRWLTVSLTVFAGAAQAANFNAVWDPPFGASLPNMGWEGRAEFFVPDECVPSGDAYVLNGRSIAQGGCGGGATVRSAWVNVYDLHDSESSHRLNFDVAGWSLGVIKLAYDDGDLRQLLTLPSAPEAAGFSGFGVNPWTYFFLEFTLEGPRLAFLDCGKSATSASIALRYAISNYSNCRFGINDNEQFRPEFIISRVPEPGSLALVGLALLLALPRSPRAKRSAVCA
jgi:hypothetical protein